MSVWKIQRFDSLPSTNTFLIDAAKNGAEEGLVAVAEHQSDGRGRFERKWESPPGKNLLFSVLLRPDQSPAEAPLLTQTTARAVADVLRTRYQLNPELKKPNDILVNGKKICGILVEAASGPAQKIDYAVIGIGLNVNAAAGELPETGISIAMALGGQSVAREALFEAILAEMAQKLPLQH